MTVFHKGTAQTFNQFVRDNRDKIHRIVVADDRVIVYHDALEDGVLIQGVFPC
jgi:hypothetical protein